MAGEIERRIRLHEYNVSSVDSRGAHTGEDRDPNVPRALVPAKAPYQLPTVHHRQTKVCYDHVRNLFKGPVQSFLAIPRLRHSKSCALQSKGKWHAAVFMVVDQQDVRTRGQDTD
ncbi:hypothetical protein LVJ94_17605 [Pendulispora rubella]|uniref:Uncharacterized protein n=1 Tax=Pendulispora rubella TaxID=2741070 RepID=A0ABZ2LDM6_9BACT